MVNLEALFHHILKPALGCTDPVAVALASAAAVQASAGWTPASNHPILHPLEHDVPALRLRVSRNIFKNVFAILIPNSGGHKGIIMAGALGAFCDPGQGMGLFRDLDSARIRAAEALSQDRRIQVAIADDVSSDIYIDVQADLAAGTGACIIRDAHDTLTCLKQDGVVIYGGTEGGDDQVHCCPELETLKGMSLAEVLAVLEELPDSVLTQLRQTVDKNVAACKAGLSRPMGIGAGYFASYGGNPMSLSHYVSSLAAAGSDARMAGYPLEIMTSAGSGNQGIVATMPVAVYARMHFVDEQRWLKALALSHLITMYITEYVGQLSALCGVAIKAGFGAACGVTYAMGGGLGDVERAIKIMAATLTGMICDGAKIGCALKVSSAAEMAMRAASLAMQKAEVPDDNGIVAPTAEQTIRNLVSLSRSMEAVDQKIIEIMQAKTES
jgi:L-cysteine desulfidase